MKFPVIKHQNYVVYLERYDDKFWLHCDVLKWTKAERQQYVKDIDKLCFHLSEPLYALIDIDNKKLMKFAILSGMCFSHTVADKYNIFVRGK